MPNTPTNSFFAVLKSFSGNIIGSQETFQIRRPTFDGVSCDYSDVENVTLNTTTPALTHPTITNNGWDSVTGMNNRNITLVCLKGFDSTLNPDQTSSI